MPTISIDNVEYDLDSLSDAAKAQLSPAITIAAKKGLVTQRASDIEPERIEWLVEGAIPMGMLVVIGGQPGMGKSQIAIKLAAAVTTGEGLPTMPKRDIVGSVITPWPSQPKGACQVRHSGAVDG